MAIGMYKLQNYDFILFMIGIAPFTPICIQNRKQLKILIK